MARNRVFYQSESVFVGPSPATGSHSGSTNPEGGLGDNPHGMYLQAEGNPIKRLQRIQSANYSFNIDRTDVNQFGELAAIDRVILTSPTVSMDMSYILANMINETNLGLTISDTNFVSAISGILNKSQDEKNYWIKTSAEGVDATNSTETGDAVGVIGIGNGFMTSYTAEGAVGDFPTASVSIEALNMSFVKGMSGNAVPGVNPANGAALTEVYVLPTGASGYNSPDPTATKTDHSHVGTGLNSALRPGDITFSCHAAGLSADIAHMGVGKIEDANIQSFSVSFDLTRTPIEKLGSKFAFSREIDFPVTVSFTVDAIMGELTTGNLASILSTDTNYDVSVTLKDTVGTVGAHYLVKKATLDSQELSSDIGSNKSVSLTFSAQVGGPNQTDVGLFFSGMV